MGKGKDKFNLNTQGVETDKPLTVEEIQTAHLNAQLAVPAILQGIMESLDRLEEHFDVIASYVQKKGLQEEIFKESDFEDDEGGEDGDVPSTGDVIPTATPEPWATKK